MTNTIYTFSFNPDWMRLTNEISRIDRFDASWKTIEKKEALTLKNLRSVATVSSVGASTRIEGSKMTDAEVELLIKNLDFNTLESRDQQEVAGYFRALDIIAESYLDIQVSAGDIQNLHKILLADSEKDAWHRGGYKQHSNRVEINRVDGPSQVVFVTTPVGRETEEAMQNLIEWYRTDEKTHPLIKTALFVYDFLSIHPFQDGNGRLSRLLATLLLLKQGYTWIKYISFEHEIERRKSDYYRELMSCQSKRPGEEVYPWVVFFLDCLLAIHRLLLDKLDRQANADKLSVREKKIYAMIENNPGVQSGTIAVQLGIPLPTLKKILAAMVKNRFISKHGIGAGTNYTTEEIITIKRDLVVRLTNNDRKKEFVLLAPGSFIEIRKIILTTLFEWEKPDEWATALNKDGLSISLFVRTNNDSTHRRHFSIYNYNRPDIFRPVFTLGSPINISASVFDNMPVNVDFPLQVSLELQGTASEFRFEVMLVYDEAQAQLIN
jgi:Fic family protein